MIDDVVCGTLLKKETEEGYELLEDMVASSYQPQYERNNRGIAVGVHQVGDFTAMSAHLEVLSRKIDSLSIGGAVMRIQEVFVILVEVSTSPKTVKMEICFICQMEH